MSIAEDFIDQMIDETAKGERCAECGWPFDDFPGCQCPEEDGESFDADGSFAHELYLDGRGDSY